MAARVNTRFVALLITVLVAVVGVGGFAYWKLYHQTAEQLRVDGEKHLAEAERYAVEVGQLSGDAALASYRRSGEEFGQATALFGQAFVKEPTNLDLLDSYIFSLERMHASTRLRAQEFHRELLGKRKLAVDLSGNSSERLEDYYSGLMEMAAWTGPAVYDTVFRDAENRIAVDPQDAVSRKYKGMVGVLRLNDSTDLNGQQAVLADLDTASASLPDDPQLALARAGYQLFEAERVQADPVAFEDAIDAALEALAAAEASGAQDRSVRLNRAETKLRVVRLLRQVAAEGQRRGGGAARATQLLQESEKLEAEVVELTAALEADVVADPAIDDLVRTADLLTATDRDVVDFGGIPSTGGLQRTEALVRAAIQSEPLNVSYKVMLGNLLRLRREHEEALKVYREADALEALGPAEMMLRTDARRRQARFEIANIELIKAEASSDPAEREKLLQGAEGAVEDLINVEQRTARVLLLEGKIALLRGQTTKAMQSLDRAVQIYADTGSPNVEAILLSARARQSEQQWGAAAERLESLLADYPLSRSPNTEARVRRQLAEIYLSSNRSAEARQQVERLEGLGIADASTQALSASLALQAGQVEDAARLFGEAGVLDNAGIVLRLTRGFDREGRQGEALEMLRAAWQEQPANAALLSELLPRLSEGERSEALAAAEAAGADPAVLALLDGSEDSASRQQLVDSLATRSESSPFDEQLRRAVLWQRMQEPAKASEALERAREIEPDNPLLITEDLRIALERGDWEAADSLAERASRENLDLAGGLFIRGQVAAAQGDTGRAIILYREALTERPVYDRGWKTLGDLLLLDQNPSDAAEAYATATRQRPDNVSALLGLANAQRSRGRDGAALSALRSAVEINPDNVSVREQYLGFEVERGDPQRAIDFRTSLIQQRPADLDNRISLARLLGSRGQARQAREILDSAAGGPDDQARIAGATAELIASEEGFDAAVAYLTERLSGLEDRVTAQDHLVLARLLASAGRADAANTAFRDAIALDSAEGSNHVALREFGDHLFASGAFDEAAETYVELLTKERLAESDLDRIRLRRAEALIRASRLTEAESTLENLPLDPKRLLLESLIANEQGNTAAARDAIEKALELEPNSSAALVQRALLADASPNAALEDVNRALEIDPRNRGTLRVRAGLLVANNQPSEAAEALENWLAEDPGDVQARIELTELRMRMGQEQAARGLVAQGRRQNPDSPVWDRVELQIDSVSTDDGVAVPALRLSMEQAPTPEALGRLAQRLLLSGESTQALAALDAEPGMLQANPALQALRGRSLVGSGEINAGENVFRNAIARSRSVAEFAIILREAAAAMDAEAAVSLASESLPPLDPAGLAVVQSTLLLSSATPERSIEILQNAEPAFASASEGLQIQRLRLYANALQKLGRASEAEGQYRELLNLLPDDVSSLNNLAFLLSGDLNRPAQAVSLARRAVGAISASAPALQRAAVLDTLGWSLHLSGELTEARESLEESIRLRPIAAAHLHLAHVYRGLNLEHLADDQARQAQELARLNGDEDVLNRATEFRGAAE